MSVVAIQDEYVDVEAAARLLDVSIRHVRRLAENGAISFGARGLVDRASIERHLANRHGSHRRAWSEETSWAAIATLSGTDAHWLGTDQQNRLSRRLQDCTAEDLVGKARDRADVSRFEGHVSAAHRLRPQVVSAKREAIGLVFMDDSVDGYVARQDVFHLVNSLGLAESSTGSIILRTTDFDLAVVQEIVAASSVLTALDAATSTDPRERGVGLETLTEHLAEYRSRVQLARRHDHRDD